MLQSIDNQPSTISNPVRRILHIDMDAFYASVEQRDKPELRGLPVAVGGNPDQRGVVAAASYEARAFGVRSAIPMARAVRMCPSLVIVRPDFSRYRVASQAVFAIFRRVTPLVEPLSLDEAYLDVTENVWGERLGQTVAQRIKKEIKEATGLTASAGVAPNKFLAKIASDWRKPDGIFVIRPHQVEAFLAPLPVGRLPGVGKVMEAKLTELGIATVGDLRQRGALELEQRFGRWGRRLHELSLGIDDHAVQPDRPNLQVSAEDTFEHDLPLDEIAPHIRRLAEKAWAAHEREASGEHARVARTVVLKLKTSDFQTLTRSFTPSSRPDSASDVAEIACALRDRVEKPAETRYRLVGVGLAGFVEVDSFAAQSDLFANIGFS